MMAEREQPLQLQGSLGLATLPRLIRQLWMSEASGTLRLWLDDSITSILFCRGDIVFAETNAEPEVLGEGLVQEGKITQSVLDFAYRVIELSDEPMGKTIVEWGWVSPAEMEARVTARVKDIIRNAFECRSGEYRFESSTEELGAPELVAKLATAETIWHGVQGITDPRAVREGVGDLKRVPRLKEGERPELPVHESDELILAQVDGRATVADVVESIPLGEDEALRRIYALHLARVLEMDAAEELSATPQAEANNEEDEKSFRNRITALVAAMQFGSYYDRLGVDVRESTENILEAYARVIESLQPGTSYAGGLEDFQGTLDRARRRIEEAKMVLSDPEQRKLYDTSFGAASTEFTIAPGIYADTGH